ncbi:hypothetical protein CDL15_Pgr012316 [Punica granatum]|uniref:Uncharacterized protein n=1 Tax=Punica granatum TaxID=22663 RepID=A0A218VVS0_PUNGR|nr:hypothetical protein CDL15_Pgr012316 [Punica granatum]
MPPSEASQIPVGHVWAYRDFPDDALAALSVVQHARRLWTLLIRVLWGDYICNPHGNFCSELVRRQSDHFQNTMTRPRKGMSGISALW